MQRINDMARIVELVFWEFPKLLFLQTNKHDATFKRWAEEMDSMQPEDWRRLRFEAEELRRRDHAN